MGRDLHPRARRSDPSTSHDAAGDAARGSAENQRDLILQRLHDAGNVGMTADALDVALFGGRHVAARRLPELLMLAAVWRTDHKRKTRQGSQAFVWLHRRYGNSPLSLPFEEEP